MGLNWKYFTNRISSFELNHLMLMIMLRETKAFYNILPCVAATCTEDEAKNRLMIITENDIYFFK